MVEPKRDYEPLAPSLPEGPIPLDRLIDGDGPLELDIGFGRGRSALERARTTPEARVIGMEIKAKWAFKVEERRKREGLENLRVYRADAVAALGRAEPPGCLARVFVHFPDPWWKKRHAKRRVVSPDLLDSLGRLIAPGGELFVQTDVEDRATAYRDLIASHEAFAVTHDGYLADNPFTSVSNREVRAAEDGLPVYRILARRV